MPSSVSPISTAPDVPSNMARLQWPVGDGEGLAASSPKPTPSTTLHLVAAVSSHRLAARGPA